MYNYACNGWIAKTIMPKWEYTWDKWQSIDLKIQERIEFVLDYSHERMANNLIDTQNFYKKCIDAKINVNDILQIAKYSPLFNARQADLQRKWIDLLMMAITRYNVSPLFKISVKIDLYNISRNALYVRLKYAKICKRFSNFFL